MLFNAPNFLPQTLSSTFSPLGLGLFKKSTITEERGILGRSLSSGPEHDGKRRGGDQGCARAVGRVLRWDGSGGRIPVRENNPRPGAGSLGS